MPNEAQSTTPSTTISSTSVNISLSIASSTPLATPTQVATLTTTSSKISATSTTSTTSTQLASPPTTTPSQLATPTLTTPSQPAGPVKLPTQPAIITSAHLATSAATATSIHLVTPTTTSIQLASTTKTSTQLAVPTKVSTSLAAPTKLLAASTITTTTTASTTTTPTTSAITPATTLSSATTQSSTTALSSTSTTTTTTTTTTIPISISTTTPTTTAAAAPTPLSKTFSAVIQAAHQQSHKQSPQTVLISLTTKPNSATTTLQQIQHLQTSLTNHPSTPPPQTYSVYAQQQSNQPQNTSTGQVVTQILTTNQIPTPQQAQQSQQQPQPTTKAQSLKYICCLQDNGVRCDRAAGNASYSRRVQKTVSLRKLNYTLDPNVRHAYICEYHKTVIQSARKLPAHATRDIAHKPNTANTTTPAAPGATRNNFNVDISSSINNNATRQQQNLGLLSQHQLNHHNISDVSSLASNNNLPGMRTAAAAVGYSHYPGPSIGPIDPGIPPLDSGDNHGPSSTNMDVDLYQLQVNTLRRYKRHFRVQTRPGLNKLQLADSLKRHFKTMPIIEKEAITYFVYIVKCNRNKLDHHLKNSNNFNQMGNNDD